LDSYRALAIFARQRLKEGGYLFLEIGFGQRAAVCRLLTGAGLSVEEVVNDYNGMERIIIAHPQFRSGF
jgi:methylase of polypeptide subunit release factors